MTHGSESRSFSKQVICASIPELEGRDIKKMLHFLSVIRLKEIIEHLDSFGEMSPDIISAFQLVQFRTQVTAVLKYKGHSVAGGKNVL
ncbi:MAG: hypothetical protein P1V18_05185 [Candidatus Gracilibacteria bacterium]|nr:hypothetical protein [Candidatus Gracilibacteria bacterium]